MPEIAYLRLVEEAASSIQRHGMVDLETLAVADSLGFSTQTLTRDAEKHLQSASD